MLPAKVVVFSARGGLLLGGVVTPLSPLVLLVSLFMPGKLPADPTWGPLGALAAALGFPPTAAGAKKDWE